MTKNYYLVLGISCSAPLEEVKSAYREKVLQFHPDRFGHDREPFLEIQEAYDILGDPQRRKDYDRQMGFLTSKSDYDVPVQFRSRPFGAPKKFQEVSLFSSFDSFSPSLEDVFERFWSNFVLETRPKAERLMPLLVEVPVSCEEARAGGERVLWIPSQVICGACGGAGRLAMGFCAHCGGEGEIEEAQAVRVAFPPFRTGSFQVEIPLNELGIKNFYLAVRFRR